MSTQQIPVKSMGLNKKEDIIERLAAAKLVAEVTNTPTNIYPKSTPQPVQKSAQTSPKEAQPLEQVPAPSTNANIFHPLQAPQGKKKTKGPKPAVNSRFSVDLPNYLIEAIGDKAHKKKWTKRVLILHALKDAGFSIRDEDFEGSTRNG